MIPIVDFGPALREPRDENAYQKLTEEILHAFSTIGFVYLRNFGIRQEKIDQYYKLSMHFFNQPFETKNKYARPAERGSFTGYIQRESERTDASARPDAYGDLNESYNYGPWNPKMVEFPDFDSANSDMFNECEKLLKQIYEVLARGLKLDDPFYFIKASQKMGDFEGNGSYLRSLYYPPVRVFKEGQVRIGEHSDYGSVTVLFQDNTGGLEVLNREGQYVPATPIDGTAVINIGDMMQRWTSDKLVSLRHRVLMPDTEEKRKSIRQSFAFFGKPDNDMIITCIDGSNKYPPIRYGEHQQHYNVKNDVRSLNLLNGSRQ